MSKQAWLAHMAEQGLPTQGRRGTDDLAASREHMAGCALCAARRKTFLNSQRRRERYDALRSLGLTKTAYGWE